MSTQQQVMGNWRELKGALKERWGQLTDQELTEAEGSREKLVGLIQRKTGETRAAIERFLDEATPAAASMLGQVADTAKEYAEAAGQQVSQAYEQVSERVQEGYAAAEEHIRQKPVQSVGIAFAAGLLTGVILGVVMRSR